MKKTLPYHSDAPTNRDALYPRACNSPLRYNQAIADDTFDESQADDECDSEACDMDED
ncbi:MAG TPA: hypothetical protein P5205_20140 [Candidatus Paceibacterota bacterium]|nr:hypothetical protein [Verrucomicrobiota bacterium]HSA12677.1 hypothetical protein [Candidatus Paceibacterota bacterium]